MPISVISQTKPGSASITANCILSLVLFQTDLNLALYTITFFARSTIDFLYFVNLDLAIFPKITLPFTHRNYTDRWTTIEDKFGLE